MPERNFLQSLEKFYGADSEPPKLTKNVLGSSESALQNVLNFAESFTLASWSLLCNKKLGVTELVFQIN